MKTSLGNLRTGAGLTRILNPPKRKSSRKRFSRGNVELSNEGEERKGSGCLKEGREKESTGGEGGQSVG